MMTKYVSPTEATAKDLDYLREIMLEFGNQLENYGDTPNRFQKATLLGLVGMLVNDARRLQSHLQEALKNVDCS